MLLDIPAVAATEGAVTSLTWRSDGIYTYNAHLFIPGSISGAFTDTETVENVRSGQLATVVGNQDSTATYLKVENINGGNPSAAGDQWIGNSSSAILTSFAVPKIPHTVFLHVTPPASSMASAYVIPQGNHSYVFSEILEAGLGLGKITMAAGKNPRQGSTIRILECVLPTFHIPTWARSGTLYNRSGADLYIRAYRPNVEANVIDTVAKTFGEGGIVGIPVADGEYYIFREANFYPGAAFMLTAASAAAEGAIVGFNG